MELLVSFFVGKPLNMLMVAAFFLVGHLVLRFTALGAGRHPRSTITCFIPRIRAAPGNGGIN
jgi:hypothetical protein